MKDNETLIELSEDQEEWYGRFQYCTVCGTEFMCDDPEFCPGCGRKIIGIKHDNQTVINLE